MYKLLNNLQIILSMNKKFIFFLLVFFICANSNAVNKIDYFVLGKKKFDLNEIDEAKLNFEKDIVRNTKNINSYLYLAKIFKIKKNENEYEKNLKTVLLLDPKNEEALYLYILKVIKDADYKLANEKFKIFESSCKNFCNKKKELSLQINKFKN